MTKLDAINEMLGTLHEFPVTALDTGGTSIEGEAERILDRVDLRIQEEGWNANTDEDVQHEAFDVTKVAMVIAAGAWTVATRRLVKVASFAAYTWAPGDQIYVSGGTDVTVGWYEIFKHIDDDTIMLKSDIADDDQADVTTTIIGWEDAIELQSDVIDADASGSSAYQDVTIRNGMLYNRYQNANTFTFEDVTSLKLKVVRQLDFTHLRETLAALIVAEAAVEFQVEKVMGFQADEAANRKLANLRMKAKRADQRTADHNMLNTTFARRIYGDRGVRTRRHGA